MTRARDVANLIGSGNYSSTTFTATAGQTAFTISHTQGFVQVFMNGLLLDETVDYTSNGSAITLTSGAAAGDEIEVVKYNTFSVGDAVPASGGTFTGNVTHSSTVTNSGNVTVGGTLGVTGKITSTAGITFGSDTAAVNVLDDYERGTYVATLTDAGGSPATITLKSNYNQLSYIKIGKQVTVYGQIRIDSISGGMSGDLRLNLPFVCQTDSTEGQSLHFSAVRSFNGNQVTGGIYLGATTVFNIGAAAAIAWVRGSGQANIAHTVIANEYLLFTHVYTTD